MPYQTNSAWSIKAGILPQTAAGAGSEDAGHPVLAASAPQAKVTTPQVLVTTALWEVTALTFTS